MQRQVQRVVCVPSHPEAHVPVFVANRGLQLLREAVVVSAPMPARRLAVQPTWNPPNDINPVHDNAETK